MDIEEAKNKLGGEFSFVFDDIINPVIQLLGLDKNSKILDVGTGKGKMAISLALNNYEVLTGEPESDDSEYAKQEWLDDAKKVNVDNLIMFQAYNAEKMPFNDNFFDAIFMMGALHHIENKISAYNECIRTVKQDGIICIIEPTPRGLKIVRKQFPSHPDAIDPRDYAGDLPVEIKKGIMFNAFIIKNE